MRTGAAGRYGLKVDAMLADMEPREFAECEASYRLDPFGDDWTQAARIEAAIKNTMGGQDVLAADLIPCEDNRKDEGEMDAATLNASVRAWLNV